MLHSIEMCNQAITNAFRECWVREQQATEEETKLGVARCISYFRYSCLLLCCLMEAELIVYCVLLSTDEFCLFVLTRTGPLQVKYWINASFTIVILFSSG